MVERTISECRDVGRTTGTPVPGLPAGLDEKEARYASMIEGVDASLGAVLAHVEQRGVAEQTIVLFTSDNGGLSAHARGESPHGEGLDKHNLPLRAGKASAYEGGTRVPWIVSWAKRSRKAEIQATLRIPSTRQLRMTRIAISPRLAMSTFLNTDLAT